MCVCVINSLETLLSSSPTVSRQCIEGSVLQENNISNELSDQRQRNFPVVSCQGTIEKTKSKSADGKLSLGTDANKAKRTRIG